MSVNDYKICRLCFNIAGNEFEVIEETVTEIFNVLLLQINLNVINNPVICWSCAEVVLKCFYFKSRCIDTEELILSVVIEKRQIGFELKDIYEDNIGDFNVCRFCMNRLETSNFIALDSLSKEVAFVEALMPLFMSDLDIDIVKDPVICTTCGEKLEYYLKFAKRCLDVEERISTYCRNQGINSIDRIHVRSLLKRNLPEKYTSKRVSEFELIRNELRDELIKAKDLNCPKCEKCTYKTKLKQHIKRHMLTHENIPYVQVEKIYKCTLCSYTSRRRNDLKSHTQTHDDDDEVEIYKCTICTYETRYESCLKSHVLIHKFTSEVDMYKCAMCLYKTTYQSNIKCHIFKHLYKSKARETYKCATCTYEARYKTGLKYHLLSHRDKSDIEMYKCATCSYETRHKTCLKSHLRSHRDKSQVETYECVKCSFETRHKNSLKYHMRRHSKSKAGRYKCKLCSYEAKHEKFLKIHMTVHKVKKVYKCPVCTCDMKQEH